MVVMPKKKPKADADRHKSAPSSFRFSDDHRKLLELLSDKTRWTMTTTIEVALERLGEEHGLWPLPDTPEKEP